MERGVRTAFLACLVCSLVGSTWAEAQQGPGCAETLSTALDAELKIAAETYSAPREEYGDHQEYLVPTVPEPIAAQAGWPVDGQLEAI